MSLLDVVLIGSIFGLIILAVVILDRRVQAIELYIRNQGWRTPE